MEFDEFINQGWQIHDAQSVTLGQQLECSTHLATTAEQALAYVKLTNYTLGHHLHEWARAEQVASTLAAKIEDASSCPALYSYLACAHYLVGDAVSALICEAKLAAGDRSTPLLTQLLVAAALSDEMRPAQASIIYKACVEKIHLLDDFAYVRELAIISNNLASDILESDTRNQKQTELMLLAALTAKEYWLQCGNWLNEVRANNLLTLAYNAADLAAEGLAYAQAAIELLDANPIEQFDYCYSLLCLAASLRLLGQQSNSAVTLAKADAMAQGFDADLVEWYQQQRHTLLEV